MKETERRRGPNNKERIRPARTDTRDHKHREKNGAKNLKPKEIDIKVSSDNLGTNVVVSDANSVSEPPQLYKNEEVGYVDDVDRSEEALHNTETFKLDEKENNEKLSDISSNWENESRDETADESEPDTINDSVSSHGDSPTVDEEKAEKVSRVTKRLAKNNSSDGYTHAPRSKSDSIQASEGTPKKGAQPEKERYKSTAKSTPDSSKNMKVHPKPLLEFSVRADDKPLEQEKKVDVLDEMSYCARSSCSDVDAVNTVEDDDQEKAALDKKIEEMESRIKQLEGELREVAALEIALYSVVPEHTSSSHKVHTPARRLSRLYIFACKYWSQDKRATVARNTISGLVLVAKSCGNDVSRLTFWLSNAVVLRQIISQAFGSSCHSSSLAKIFESNGGAKNTDPKSSSFKRKSITGSRQLNKQGFLQFVDDWQETRTFTAALEKVESWIFSRIVESVWWQTLTPNMQSPVDDSTTSKAAERLLGPALGDQLQGNFSINLWKNAFQDSLKRLCPVRAGCHECGCLPVLARKVMDQCIGRLDVAMFNAILRESAHEIPTDPVSDPIVDSKVLPIPAGDLSFGSGAQLKNSVGNWARWLTDFLGMDADSSLKDQKNSKDDKMGGDEPKCFPLLNALSDLLMLPKDMLMNRTIRMEVCPTISIPLVKRILCNFTPDEFCPDPVPGAVLEALNAECIIERRLSGGSASSFPYLAAPVVYTPPTSTNVAEKVAEAGENSQLSHSASAVQRKGYTSDDELNELESCPTSIVDELTSPPVTLVNGSGNDGEKVVSDEANARYELLREVWLSTD